MNPYFSPLICDDFTGLPPAFILTCQHDVLRDEGILYSQKLQADGVYVQHENSRHGYHGMFFSDTIKAEPEAAKYYGEAVSFVKNMFRDNSTS